MQNTPQETPSQIEGFLCEVLACERIQDIPRGIARFFTPEGGLDIDTIFKDNLCRGLLLVDELFMNSFGIHAPSKFAKRILAKYIANKEIFDMMTQTLAASVTIDVCNETFLNFANKDTNSMVSASQAFLSRLTRDPDFARQRLFKYLTRYSRKPLPTQVAPSIFKTYVEHIYKESTLVPMINNDTNVFTANKLDWSTSTDAPATFALQRDVDAYNAVCDFAMYRQLATAPTITIMPFAAKDAEYIHMVCRIAAAIMSVEQVAKFNVIADANTHANMDLHSDFNYNPIYISDSSDLALIPLQLVKLNTFVAPSMDYLSMMSDARDLFKAENNLVFTPVSSAAEVNTLSSAVLEMSPKRNARPVPIATTPDAAVACIEDIERLLPYVPYNISMHVSMMQAAVKIVMDFFTIPPPDQLDQSKPIPPNKHPEFLMGRVLTYFNVFKSLLRYYTNPAVHKLASNDKCVVLIDTRKNGLSSISLYASLANLKHSEWDVVVFTSKASEEFWKLNAPYGGTVVTGHPSLERTPFDIDTVNNFMMDPWMWRQLMGLNYKKCLIIQDDGVVVRPGLEDSAFMRCDYVGAPWLRCPPNNELAKILTPNMVGNGGVSFRDVKMCLDITENANASNKNKVLFNNKLQRVQEDVFFSKEVQARGGLVPTEQEAQSFAVEQVFAPNAFAFHKLWAYNNTEKVCNFFGMRRQSNPTTPPTVSANLVS